MNRHIKRFGILNSDWSVVTLKCLLPSDKKNHRSLLLLNEIKSRAHEHFPEVSWKKNTPRNLSFILSYSPKALTHTRVVTREPVTMTTPAVVTSPGVVALVLTSSATSVALVHICQSKTHTVNQSQNFNVCFLIGRWCVCGRGHAVTQKLSVEMKLLMTHLSSAALQSLFSLCLLGRFWTLSCFSDSQFMCSWIKLHFYIQMSVAETVNDVFSAQV